MNINNIISSMVVTEKANNMNEHYNILTLFTSSVGVSKAQVKQAFNFHFPDLQIDSIRSMILHPKKKNFKGRRGECVKRKKVMISFKQGGKFEVEEN